MEGSMRKKILCLASGALFFALCLPAKAQQPAKVAKLGWLGARSAGGGARTLGQELSTFGYVEGKNFAIERRYAEDKLDRLPILAEELVRLKVDILVVPSTNEALAAKNATKTIPIVFLNVTDPISAGLIDSLPRPGGNITGFTTIAGVLASKRLELLKETAPTVSRVALLWDPRNEGSVQQW